MSKYMRSKFVASLLLAGTSSMIVPQAEASSSAPPSKVLQVQGGAIELRGMSTVEVERDLLELTARGKDRHVILDLATSNPDREAFEAKGVKLLSSLGGRTWIASIAPKAAVESTAIADRVTSIRSYEKSFKVHPFLADGGVPKWVVERRGRDPHAVFYVLAHGDVSLDRFEQLVEESGGKVRSRIESLNGLVIAAKLSKVDSIAELEESMWIEPALPKFETQNAGARENTNVDTVQLDPAYGLDGTGVSVMVYDGGFALADHEDFGGRLTVRDASGLSDHGTHVAGTIGGDGSLSGGEHRGMAPGVTLESYGFDMVGGFGPGGLYTDPGDIEADYFDAMFNHGVDITNNSIGSNTAPNGFPCDWTGNYGITSALIDALARDNDIRIVWANGNERQTNRCGDEYYTTSPPACAKNHISVGAMNSDDEATAWFTSWGPTDDGRVKPDISAPGDQSGGDGGITSTSAFGGYTVKFGTSMATPVVTGISALILEEWRNLNPGEPDLHNAALKALLANSGVDLGNPGPDCRYGFGTVRADAAIDAIRNRSLIEESVVAGDNDDFQIQVPEGEDELRITLAWDDAPGNPMLLNALVNDLDLVVKDPTGAQVDPWTIDPANPGAPATRSGPDRLNNMEQVTVRMPMAGIWTVEIVGTSVPEGPQAYGLATSVRMGRGDECWDPITATVGQNTIDLEWMTLSPDAPENGDCQFLEWGDHDAWFVFDAPTDGLLSLDFCASDFDTSVVVYRGQCDSLVRIACDDDSCNPEGPGFQSGIADLPISAGRHYIRVGGWDGATGIVDFHLDFAAAADECIDAVEIMPETWMPFDTDLMTASAEEAPDGECTFLDWDGSNDAWFFYKAPQDQTISISLCASQYDTSMIVYQGECDSLFRIACDDDSCEPEGPGYQSKIEHLDVETGYVFVRIGGYKAAEGHGYIYLEEVTPCDADLTGDGQVDAADMAQILVAWGECADCEADLNGDGVVDAADLALVLVGWGACG